MNTDRPSRKENQETDNRLPTGEWNGFYIERARSGRGWMSMYLQFENGRINGEGTDYVGPWVATGSYDTDTGLCSWTKQYLGLHQVVYSGKASSDGIRGDWQINISSGPFHIWPMGMTNTGELYLKNEYELPQGEGSLMDSIEEALQPALSL